MPTFVGFLKLYHAFKFSTLYVSDYARERFAIIGEDAVIMYN